MSYSEQGSEAPAAHWLDGPDSLHITVAGCGVVACAQNPRLICDVRELRVVLSEVDHKDLPSHTALSSLRLVGQL